MTLKADWAIFVALTVMGSLGFHIFSRYAKGNIDPLLAVVICNGAAFAICLAAYLIYSGTEFVKPSNSGLIFSVLAGVFVGLANFSVFAMYKSGLSVSIAVPMTRAAVAMGAVVFGILLFSEKLTLANAAGIILSVISLVLLTL